MAILRVADTLREDLKGKSGRLKNFFLPVSPLYFRFVSFFLTDPDEQLCKAFTFIPHNLSETKFYRKMYNIFSEERDRKANDTLFRYL